MIVIYNYVYRNNFKKQMLIQTIFSGIYSLVYCLFIDIWYGLIQLGTFLSYHYYQDIMAERGKWKWMKYFFYFIYPVHLIICGIIMDIFTWQYFSYYWRIKYYKYRWRNNYGRKIKKQICIF